MSLTDTAESLHAVTKHEYQHVIDRIQLSFPELDPREIQQIVDSAVHQHAGARLRQFVPLLVERVARDECRSVSNGNHRVVQLPAH